MTRQYQIAKETVKEAWGEVKENKGAAGIDGQTVEDFEADLENNLYKIWNRMTSGSYFPPAVKEVEIPKNSGGNRKLGIPTVADRVAQGVAKKYLEPEMELQFHEDSYGYRPNKSQHQALERTRERCRRNDWVIEIDIKGYFDNISHEILMGLLQEHTKEKWILLYVRRWLMAGTQTQEGTIKPKEKGTPQGSVISPLLSNIYLHHAFDMWMKDRYPYIPFERFADDIIVHCKSLKQAEYIRKQISERMKEWQLELHKEKTRIVYCKDSNRPGNHEHIMFTFLGYTFKPRRARNGKTGKIFTSFQPAISQEAKMEIYKEIQKWKLAKRTQRTLESISEEINVQIRGWFNYFDKFYASALNQLRTHIDYRLIHWAIRKYKSLGKSKQRGRTWLTGVMSRQPKLFAHWNQPTSSSWVTRAV